MTKAFLKFDLNDPDDKQDFQRMTKALDMAAALWDVKQRIRDSEKYNKSPISLQDFNDLLFEKDVNLDQLYS